MATSTQETKWRSKHAVVRCEEGIEELGAPLATVGRSDDLRALAEQVCRKRGLDVNELFTDLSQSADRRPWTLKALRAITTSTELWCHAKQRHLSLPELYALLGFEGVSFEGLSPHQAKNLLGESMAVPCVTLMVMSVIVNLPAVFAEC